METLRIRVERIVRPIRGAGWRKDRMREELLAHLQQAYDAGLREGLSVSEAEASACARLGDVNALREELQRTISPIERAMYIRMPFLKICDRWFSKKEGESALHFAAVRTLYTGIFLTVALVVVVGVVEAINASDLVCARLSVGPDVITLLRFVTYAFFGSAAAYWATDILGIRRILSRESPAGALKKGSALVLFLSAYCALLVTLACACDPLIAYRGSERIQTALRAISHTCELWAFAALFLLVVIPWIAWVMTREHRHYERWEKLRIDED